ncbi:MAG: hypothetical protein D6734_04115 [Candidatus Schekmanbacteria bacterium]|nr:MAG: hypothetical protein D6734_04115 [Candidatus Schekmanbacteria bacterium]
MLQKTNISGHLLFTIVRFLQDFQNKKNNANGTIDKKVNPEIFADSKIIHSRRSSEMLVLKKEIYLKISNREKRIAHENKSKKYFFEKDNLSIQNLKVKCQFSKFLFSSNP